ncbi:MAG: type II toxin-antitoxin system VapC family toxin [Alphaproteobacteria bacterium]|nr:type II toxin-antitoxin system VapC family toxin [Alphaproteobacteria bacterium]MCW5740357.1 type II toxin-antitoxin system VapC family toxin [Alphaproteobacteria bacterium]
MRLLLDTHTFLWWVFADSKLSRRAREAILDEQNEAIISAVTAWEIATRYRIGKLPEASVVANDIVGAIAGEGFTELALSVAHAQRAGSMGGKHQDPFDRMLAAQALLENLVLVSNDRAFEQYAIERLW